MKYLLILFLFGFQLNLMALDLGENNSSRYDNDPIVRLQMLREAKFLMQEYEMLQNRLKSWQIHKNRLIKRFEAENRDIAQMHLGQDGNYGFRLAQKRKEKFYASLEMKEKRIKKRLFGISRKLSNLKEEYRFRYAVELTKDEIFHGKAPRIEDREEKINLLQEYIKYSESYEHLRSLNARYDRAENLMQSIAKINDEEKNFEQNLTKRAQQNHQKMVEYQMMVQRLSEEFYNRYQMQISSLQMARQFLHNLRTSER